MLNGLNHKTILFLSANKTEGFFPIEESSFELSYKSYTSLIHKNNFTYSKSKYYTVRRDIHKACFANMTKHSNSAPSSHQSYQVSEPPDWFEDALDRRDRELAEYRRAQGVFAYDNYHNCVQMQEPGYEPQN